MNSRYLKILIILLLLFYFYGCASIARKIDERREIREKRIAKGYENMKKLAHSGLYEFKADRAYSSNYSSMDITGSYYYLIINYYDVEAFLPYYGTRYMADPHNTGGIRINGKLEKLMIEESDSRHRVRVKFSVSSNSETFLINLDIGPSGEAMLTISSSKRSSITYMGTVSETETETEEEEEKEQK
ncbi:MAG: DUF4251 domain-containing protein [Bacteroidales bacterium]|nr:DUF4251 domain-containing protein [Bacteroidales bacterium]